MAVASLALSAASAGLSIIGGLATAHAQSEAATYQAAVAKANAEYTERAGRVEEQGQMLKTNQLVGSIRAAEGANGFDINTGSAYDVQASAKALGELDAATIRSNTSQRVKNLLSQGTLYTKQAAAASTAGWINAAGSLIGGASNVADKWLTYKSIGAF